MVINSSFKNYVNSLIKGDEVPSEIKKGELISVYYILEVLKEKEKRKEHILAPYVEEIKKVLPNVEHIYYKMHNPIYMILEDNEKRNIVLKYLKNGKTIGTFLDKETEDFILHNQNLFREIALYGIINKYGDSFKINTVSNAFELKVYKDFIGWVKISNSPLIKGNFNLTWDTNFTLDSKFKTNIFGDLGMNGFDTDIIGLENVFSNTNDLLDFYKHLYVYNHDLPKYLEEEYRRIRTK